MYTIKDLVSDKFVLLNEMNLVEVEGINSVSTIVESGKQKRVIAHVGLTAFLFEGNFKNIIRQKVKRDLGENFQFTFGV